MTRQPTEVEDILWLIESREDPMRITKRLGVSARTIKRTLIKAGYGHYARLFDRVEKEVYNK